MFDWKKLLYTVAGAAAIGAGGALSGTTAPTGTAIATAAAAAVITALMGLFQTPPHQG